MTFNMINKENQFQDLWTCVFSIFVKNVTMLFFGYWSAANFQKRLTQIDSLWKWEFIEFFIS